MKTPQQARSRAISIAVRSLLPATFIGVAAIPATGGPREDKPVEMEKVVVSETKTHTLFMGADISVGLDKQLYAVRDVSGSSWVIDVEGKTTLVPLRSGSIDMKITPSLKLTDVSATLAGLRATPAYSAKNDPNSALTQSLADSAALNAGYQSSVHLAQASLVRTQAFAQAISGVNNQDVPLILAEGGRPIPMLPSEGALNSNAMTRILTTDLNQVTVSAGEDLETTGNRGFSAGYDAMEVSFAVSSEHRLNNPFVVTITRLRDKGGKPGMIRKLVYAKALHPIDRDATAVHFLEEGFPPGYEQLDFELHLYDRGTEVATSVSAKRVDLTREEAFEYVKFEYVGAHKGDTLPAVPAMAKLPAALPVRLAEGKYAETFYVRVSKDGLASEAFVDAACARKIGDPFLDSVVRSLRFKPALAKGIAVEGTAAVNLNKLTI